MKNPDLLLLHGAIATQDQFTAITPLLEDHFNCHTLNFTGHGKTISDQPFDIAQFAKDVIHWMETNACEKIDIFGYSMGGYVALYFAYHYPEKVGKVFTLATKLDWTPENAQQETRLLNPEKIAAKIPAFAQMLDSIHHDWKAVLHNTAQMMITMGNAPMLTNKALSEINHQVVIAVGDQDSTASPEHAQQVSNILPNGELLILSNTPHPFEKVDQAALSHHIKDFFA